MIFIDLWLAKRSACNIDPEHAVDVIDLVDNPDFTLGVKPRRQIRPQRSMKGRYVTDALTPAKQGEIFKRVHA